MEQSACLEDSSETGDVRDTVEAEEEGRESRQFNAG